MSDYKTLESQIRKIHEKTLDADKLRIKSDLAKRDGKILSRPGIDKDLRNREATEDEHIERRQAHEIMQKRISAESTELFNGPKSVEEAIKSIITEKPPEEKVSKKKNRHIKIAGVEEEVVVEAKADLNKMKGMTARQRAIYIKQLKNKNKEEAVKKKEKSKAAPAKEVEKDEESYDSRMKTHSKARNLANFFKEVSSTVKDPDLRQKIAQHVVKHGRNGETVQSLVAKFKKS